MTTTLIPETKSNIDPIFRKHPRSYGRSSKICDAALHNDTKYISSFRNGQSHLHSSLRSIATDMIKASKIQSRNNDGHQSLNMVDELKKFHENIPTSPKFVSITSSCRKPKNTNKKKDMMRVSSHPNIENDNHPSSVTGMTPKSFLLFSIKCAEPQHKRKPRSVSAFKINQNHFLSPPTHAEIESYMEGSSAMAARTGNVAQLRNCIESGVSTATCRNKFGESLLHVACRRANIEVVKYLLEEVKISPFIRDDFGRTPFHDACWNPEPEMGLLSLLIRADPDLLLVEDKRGHTPLDYVREEHHSQWIKFLAKIGGEALKPRRDEFWFLEKESKEKNSDKETAIMEQGLATLSLSNKGEERGRRRRRRRRTGKDKM